MTAEAILCRMYLGWQKDDPRLVSAIDWITRYHLPNSDAEFNVYYWYYAMQALHHYGGSKWQAWNRSVSNLLILSQETRGKHPGSWDPDRDTWGCLLGESMSRPWRFARSRCTIGICHCLNRSN